MEEKEANSPEATTRPQAPETAASALLGSANADQNDINNTAEDAEREDGLAVHESPVEEVVIDPSTLNPLSPEVISRHKHTHTPLRVCSCLL